MRRYIYDFQLVAQERERAHRGHSRHAEAEIQRICRSRIVASSQLPPSSSLPASGSSSPSAITSMVVSWQGPERMVLLAGWAVDWPACKLAGGVRVVVDGVEHPRYGLPSAEAVEKLGSKDFYNAGFRCVIPLTEFEPGWHTLSLNVFSHDRTSVFQSPSKPIYTR